MHIEQANRCDPELLAAINGLLPQLSRSAQPLGETDLQAILDTAGSHLFLALDDDGRLCGMLTLATFRIPTGIRAWIEDVVVDEAERGKGVASALLDAAIAEARRLGARTLDLTSRPSREAANRLYRKAGFAQRETNVYRLNL